MALYQITMVCGNGDDDDDDDEMKYNKLTLEDVDDGDVDFDDDEELDDYEEDEDELQDLGLTGPRGEDLLRSNYMADPVKSSPSPSSPSPQSPSLFDASHLKRKNLFDIQLTLNLSVKPVE